MQILPSSPVTSTTIEVSSLRLTSAWKMPQDKFKAPVPRIYEQDMNDAEYEDYNEPDSEVPENDDADERKE